MYTLRKIICFIYDTKFSLLRIRASVEEYNVHKCNLVIVIYDPFLPLFSASLMMWQKKVRKIDVIFYIVLTSNWALKFVRFLSSVRVFETEKKKDLFRRLFSTRVCYLKVTLELDKSMLTKCV